jgi:isocitrate lyase
MRQLKRQLTVKVKESKMDIKRTYSESDVISLRGSLQIEYTLAKEGAIKFRRLLNQLPATRALGCVTGNQAVQAVKAGLKSVYVSGWQTAADANLSNRTYPDLSLYPVNSVPNAVKRINSALQRADQIEIMEKGKASKDYYVPIIADAEAGFGGVLNVYELVQQLIEAGAAAVHLEDQLAAEKKCGHLNGKILIPTQQAIQNLISARLAADVCNVPTVLIARTDANAADMLTNNFDERDHPFLTGDRTSDGFYCIRNGIAAAISRGLAYAPFADLLWCETSRPDLKEAQRFSEAILKEFPDKKLAYNNSPSFNWRKCLSAEEIQKFHIELNAMGYKFQFITLAGFHSLNHSFFKLSKAYKEYGMTAYANLQDDEFLSEADGYEAVRHQREVGTGYFDKVKQIIVGNSSALALKGSTEDEQF